MQLRLSEINFKMQSFANHIVILAIFCLSPQLVKTHDLRNYVTITKNFSDREIFVDDVGIYKTNLVYAVCEFSKDKTKTDCQIKRLTNNQNPEKSCNISVKNQGTVHGISWQAMSLNANKAMLLWSKTNNRTTFTKFSIVDFNNCHVTDHEIAVDKQLKNIPVVVHNNDYELLIINSELCGDKLCKLSFDFNGNRISGPSPWFSNVTEEMEQCVFDIHSAPNGIINGCYNLEDARAEISFIRSDGLKVLKQYILKSWILYGWVATISTNYETIRMCTSENTTVTCQQFDPNGKPIAEHKTNVGYYISNLVVHNLPNGEYVVMTAGCLEEPIFNCHGYEDHYNLTKLNANGTKFGALNITKLKCLGINKHLYVKFFENETKEPCMSFACLSKIGRPKTAQLNFTSKCFSDGEFTN